MIHFVIAGMVFGMAVVTLISLNYDSERLVDLMLELEAERAVRMDAERRAATHQRTAQHLQYELDQRNGWQAGDEVLSPIMPPALTLMEEYQPHTVEWLPFSLN